MIEIITYTPHDWHWIVGGDTSRAWSSAAAAWATAWPAERVTRIGSAAELRDVLAPHGLRAPVATAADVRAEAQRRIVALTGATDFNGCIVRQLNASMRATELTNKLATGQTLSAPEQAEATALKALADRIKEIRAASNAMEADPPADFRNDARWV